MAENYGEWLFARYVAARGHLVLAREPDLGTPKLPDFLIQAGPDEIVVEVKTFDPPLIGRRGRRRAIRSRIGKGAEQLRGIDGRALVVVLISPLRSSAPLTPVDILDAMHGDLAIDEASGQHVLGSNAKAHIKEPDGASHGDHAYLSAIALMSCAPGHDEGTVYLDVFETVSSTAHRLPRTVFNGPLDGRWGQTAPGRYGPLTPRKTIPGRS